MEWTSSYDELLRLRIAFNGIIWLEKPPLLHRKEMRRSLTHSSSQIWMLGVVHFKWTDESSSVFPLDSTWVFWFWSKSSSSIINNGGCSGNINQDHGASIMDGPQRRMRDIHTSGWCSCERISASVQYIFFIWIMERKLERIIFPERVG